MKLTDENMDGMDCRPLTGKLMMDTPDYMQGRMAKVAAQREAACPVFKAKRTVVARQKMKAESSKNPTRIS